MRLLRLDQVDRLGLHEFIGKSIPPYAILSHTWGPDNEEISFKDLTEGTGKDKAGLKKILFCADQAAEDGLEYFWVDTCCIDKSSSAELSEAINSMFRWYYEAAKCYVFLSDVRINIPYQDTLKQPFHKSKWFTRGWTLQELLAPREVVFFDCEGDELGDKVTLVQIIHKATGISVQALKGKPLSQFSVEERMSWAVHRETKREEDAAYCLLGLFDIHMPLIYGEGRKKALFRLRKKIRKSLMEQAEEVLLEIGTQKRETQSRIPSFIGVVRAGIWILGLSQYVP